MNSVTKWSKALIFMMMLILLNPSTAFASPTITALGNITIASPKDATSIFTRAMERGQEGFFQVGITNKYGNIDYNQAMNTAYSNYKTSPLYFMSHPYIDADTNKCIYRVGRVDCVVNTQQEFSKFLLGNKNRVLSELTIKLNDYVQNNQYPYSNNFGLDGSFTCEDVLINENTAIRTLKCFNTLNEKSAKTYTVIDEEDMKKALKDSISNFYKQVTIETAFETDSFDLKRIYDELKNDFDPFVFSKAIQWTETDGKYTVNLAYLNEASKCKQLYDDSIKKATEITAALIRPGMDDYDKILAIHRYVVKQTTYDFLADHFMLSPEETTTFVGPLLNNHGTYSGYTGAMKILLDRAGIKNEILKGTTHDLNGGQVKRHSWNRVYLDEIPYHIDATWDDVSGWENPYAYFLVGDQTLRVDHTWDQTKYASCSNDYMATLPEANYNDLLKSSNQYLGVGDSGAVIHSYDGEAWTALNPPTVDNLKSIAYGADRYVTVGSDGAVLCSEDGKSWSSIYVPIAENLNKVVYLGGRFIAVGDGGTLMVSANGYDWSVCNMPTSQNLYDVAYNGRTYVAVGLSGSLITSTNSSNWKTVKVGVQDHFTAVAYGNGFFLTSASSGAFYKSTNGTNWTRVADLSKSNLYVERLVFGKNQFVGIGKNTLVVMKGAQLTYAKNDYADDLKSLSFFKDQFMALGNDNTLYSTTKGDISTFRKIHYTLKK